MHKNHHSPQKLFVQKKKTKNKIKALKNFSLHTFWGSAKESKERGMDEVKSEKGRRGKSRYEALCDAKAYKHTQTHTHTHTYAKHSDTDTRRYSDTGRYADCRQHRININKDIKN